MARRAHETCFSVQSATASLKLSPTRAAVALAVGAAFALAGWQWGAGEPKIAGIMLAVALAWASMVDIDRLILPNVITLGLIVAGLGLAATEGWSRLLDCALGAAVGYLSLAGVAWLFLKLRGKDGLGAGDWKLFAAAGAWLGWQDLPQVMLIASVSALVIVGGVSLVRRKQPGRRYSAFGPFIALAFWIVWSTGGVVWLAAAG